MNALFAPSALHGAISAPPSKSLTHRLLLCAALARGESVIENVAPSGDVLAMCDCLRALGAKIAASAAPPCGGEQRAPARYRVTGFDPFAAPSCVPDCRESAATLRFLLPLCLLSGHPVTLTGSPRLLTRPLTVYEELCRAHDCRFVWTEMGVTVCGPLRPGAYTIPGDVSSQFASGLLFALPLLDGDSTLTLLPPVVSRPYLDLTLSALEDFGILIRKNSDYSYEIPGNQQYSAKAAAVEGDWSNAAPFFALRALGHAVGVTGLRADSLQGDRAVVPLLDALARGFAEVDLTDCPDLGPSLFVAAAALHGGRFTGVRRLRGKESDRVAAMQAELGKLGVATEAEGDVLTVRPAVPRVPSCPLEGHNDHRVCMALSVLLVRTGGELRGAEAVSKSWPDYFDALRRLGAEMRFFA